MVDKRPLIGFDTAHHTGISHGDNTLNLALAHRRYSGDNNYFRVKELPGICIIATGTVIIGEMSQQEIFQHTLTFRRR